MEESVNAAPEEGQSVETKIKELTPQSKRVDVLAKCLEIGEAKEIPGRFGNTRKVAEATLADESGAIVMSLWDEQIGTVAKEDTVHVKNGYVSLVRGHMRLNVGKYGNLLKAEKAVETTVTEPNLSEKEYEMERKRYSGGGGDRGGGDRGGRPRSGGGGSYGSGSRDNDDRPKYMNKGRRRF
ncbi:MAG: single-stranded DNA-binding protein [Thermoplasmata archaeon]|nr:single-stranded DNA-binding protein [Thermoplasmata archaeon]MCJ7561854.1 single-stranded DNA-binding protein [Thermoplasmata archaeon]